MMIRDYLYRMFNVEGLVKQILDITLLEKEEIYNSSDCYARFLPVSGTGIQRTWKGSADKLALRAVACDNAAEIRINRMRKRAGVVKECLEYLSEEQKQIILDYYQNLSSVSKELEEAEFNLMVEIEWNNEQNKLKQLRERMT